MILLLKQLSGLPKTMLRILFIAILLPLSNSSGLARGLDLASGSNDKPIEIFADEGIEWIKDKELLVAKGNAKASRGGVTVKAKVLRAFYRKNLSGKTDLYRLDAFGGVVIYSSTESITGQSAALDLEKAILVVSGKKVIYRTETSIITATKQMEYWERQLMAVARGRAFAKHEGKILRADILKALFYTQKNGGSKLRTIEAFNNVFIRSQTDRIRADYGIYRVKLGIATLSKNVTITRGNSILTGQKAEVNLETGISKLLTIGEVKDPSGKRKRVRGLIFPQRN